MRSLNLSGHIRSAFSSIRSTKSVNHLSRLRFLVTGSLIFIGTWLSTSRTEAAIVTGFAVLTFDEAASASTTPLTTLDARFDNTNPATPPFYSDILSDPGLPVTRDGLGALAPITFAVNPTTITNGGAGRSIQATTLDFNASNILGSWTPVTSDNGVFVTGGEQIGLEGATRWTGPFTGALLFGDFALKYSPSRASGSLSGLVLTSNIGGYSNAAYADIANATITTNGGLLSISGDMLYSNGVAAFPGASGALGTNIGRFELNQTTAVPEPTSLLLSFVAASGLALKCRRKIMKSSPQSDS